MPISAKGSANYESPCIYSIESYPTFKDHAQRGRSLLSATIDKLAPL